MRLALRELRRRPGRFVVATSVLALISLLLLVLGGLLDGLTLGSTGAIRVQQADVFVFSATARNSIPRSRITPELRAQVEKAPGVTSVGGLGIGQFGAAVPDHAGLVDIALIGYQQPATGIPAPPAPGEGYADRRLESSGVSPGQTIEVGPAKTPVKIVGWVEDSSYVLQGTVWVEPGTWRAAQNANRPDARVADGLFQVLIASGSGTPASLAASIDAATQGQTETLTKNDAVLSLPGTRQQQSTFLQIIFTTLFVAALVVGLFFSLLTLERAGLYGVLKALGSSSGQLFAGLIAQALVVTGVAVLIGGAVTLLMVRAVPPTVPIQLVGGRVAFVVSGMAVAAVLGSIVSLRRVVRIDPASAIGSST